MFSFSINIFFSERYLSLTLGFPQFRTFLWYLQTRLQRSLRAGWLHLNIRVNIICLFNLYHGFFKLWSKWGGNILIRERRDEGEQVGGLFWMEGMDVCGMGTKASLFFSGELDANDSVSRLVLSNNSSYNLCSFAKELIHLGKSLLLKIACVEWKMVFPCVYCMKWYPLSSYSMNIINSKCGVSLLAQISVGRNRLYSQRHRSAMFWVCFPRRSLSEFKMVDSNYFISSFLI